VIRACKLVKAGSTGEADIHGNIRIHPWRQETMNILFVHQNFPGQFPHLAPALAARGERVVALHINACPAVPGVKMVRYQVTPPQRPAGPHRWLGDLDTKVHRGEAAWRAARELDAGGFSPDVIVAHPGWGESLFLKDVWPAARLGIYCEFYYRTEGADVGFDPEFQSVEPEQACRLRMKNANFELHFPMAHGGLSPTLWQRSVFPLAFQPRITVMHDGIDTDRVQPNAQASLKLKTRSGAELDLRPGDEIITFVNRNLEPYRGWHIFARALPRLLRERPQARVLIVGGDEVSYGSAPRPGPDGAPRTWRQVMLEEVNGGLDHGRVHFLGRIPYGRFVTLLQLSMVHVYLTYPFVLSWSLLEAMSAGCAIVASDTAPVREAVVDGRTGLLVDFFDGAALVRQVVELLERPALRAQLGQAAREHAIANYDLRTKCLPGQLAWVGSLAG
jgi:glycosyltransferase involved in cell wall biosynthesis